MLVIGDVEQVHGLTGQKPAVLASFGHAPQHRSDPAAPAQGAQHPPHLVFLQVQRRGRLATLARGILALSSAAASVGRSVVAGAPLSSLLHLDSSPSAAVGPAPFSLASNPLQVQDGYCGEFRSHTWRHWGELFLYLILDIRFYRPSRLPISWCDGRKPIMKNWTEECLNQPVGLDGHG